MGSNFREVMLVAALLLLTSWKAAEGSSQTIEGKVLWPDDVTKAAKIKLVMNMEHGHKIFAWPRADGAFTFHGVPEGVHLLDVNAIGLLYPQIRLDVNGVYPGGALASLAIEPSKILPPPLILQPLGPAEYFEKHEPFNVISFLKTPYGLMAAFGIFAIVVLPRMKLDPEELKEATESLSGRSTAREMPAIRQRN